MNIDKLINKFRLASRELFNNYFLETFLENEDWDFYELFYGMEEQLFFALVASRIGINGGTYGQPQQEILAIPDPKCTSGIPIMLNREIDSGYWDHPTNMAIPACKFTFVSFFDWDQKSYKDNRYLKIIVKDWPENPSLIGKYALIETQYLSYIKA
jgi:hypothetical protein